MTWSFRKIEGRKIQDTRSDVTQICLFIQRCLNMDAPRQHDDKWNNSNRKTNIALFLMEWIQSSWTQENRVGRWLKGREKGKMLIQWVKVSVIQMYKLCNSNVPDVVCIIDTIAYLKFTKWLDRKCSHYATHRWQLCEMMDKLSSLFIVFISQYVHISTKHQVIYLEYIPFLFVRYTMLRKKKWKN